MLIVLTYKCPTSQKSKHTIKVFSNKGLTQRYDSISTDTKNFMLSKLSNHKIVERYTIANARELNQ